MTRSVLTMALLAIVGQAQAQSTPAGALDAAWNQVCPGAAPDSAFFARCQDIINAGPGSGDRRSAAATGNNFGTVAGVGRQQSTTLEREEPAFRFEDGQWAWFAAARFGSQARDQSDLDAGYDSDERGGLVGVDYRFNDALTAGVVLNYVDTALDFKATRVNALGQTQDVGNADSKSTTLLAKLDLNSGEAWAFGFYGGIGRQQVDLSRLVAYTLLTNVGTPEQAVVEVSTTAFGETDATLTRYGARAGYTLPFGDMQVEISGALDGANVEIDGYTETGGDGLAMTVDSQDVTSLQAKLGLRLSGAMSTSNNVLTPYVGFDLVGELDDEARVVSAAFAGDQAGQRFSFDTEESDSSFYEVNLGLAMTFGGGTALFADYRQRFGHEFLDDQALTFGARFEL